MQISEDTLLAIADTVEGELRLDYSGRGMFGKRCPGITHSVKPMQLGATIAHLINESIHPYEDGELIEYMTESYSRDSMGYDDIVYWPSLEVVVW